MNLIIYCDGGLGNRINSLITGLALYDTGLFNKCSISWPASEHCMASFFNLLEINGIEVNENPLDGIKAENNKIKAVVQDKTDAELLSVSWHRAIDFSDREAFIDYIFSDSNIDTFLLYTGLLPSWLDRDINEQARLFKKYSVRINNDILLCAKDFIENNLPGTGYYSIHLRRTDNPIGYTSRECSEILFKNPLDSFFICSDSKEEKLKYNVFSNVILTEFHNDVIKKDHSLAYRSPIVDSMGRRSEYNVVRSKMNVVEGFIELIILGFGNQVGLFRTGSTFQSLAVNIPSLFSLGARVELKPIPYVALRDIRRFIKSGSINKNHLTLILDSLKCYERVEEGYYLLNYLLKSSLLASDQELKTFVTEQINTFNVFV